MEGIFPLVTAAIALLPSFPSLSVSLQIADWLKSLIKIHIYKCIYIYVYVYGNELDFSNPNLNLERRTTISPV